MKKKICIGITMLLELALFAGAFVVSYFTRKKMGMARHVIFLNQKWQRAYPLETWKVLSILLLALLLLAAVWLLVKRRKTLSPYLLAEGILSLALTGYSLFFTLTNSAATLRPYYMMSPMLACAALVQLLRTLLLLTRREP